MMSMKRLTIIAMALLLLIGGWTVTRAMIPTGITTLRVLARSLRNEKRG